MGHQPCDAAIAVKEWVDPQKAVMGSGDRKDRICLSDIAVDIRKSVQKAGHGARTDGNVMAYANISFAQLAGDDALAFPGRWIFYPEKIFRKQCAESPMNVTDSFDAERADGFQATFIDPFLNCDMRFRFELQIPFPRVLAVVIPERSFYVDWVRVVSLDEVRVIAVHGTNEGGKRAY
jgi:hypothetical protein